MSSAIVSSTTATGLLETLVVAVIVALFAWRALRQLLPALHRRIVEHLRRVLGMAAVDPVGKAGSCDSGCGSCNNCGPAESAPKPAREAPLQFRPRRH